MTLTAPRLAAVWLGLLSGASACGGDDGGSLADATSDFARVYCPRLFECCSSAELGEKFAGSDPPVTDVAACQAVYDGLGALLELTLDAERAAYHPERMAECVDQVRAWSCEELRATEPLADRLCGAIEGMVDIGGACGEDMECRTGHCDADGICREWPGEGDACTDQCGDGLYCRIADAGEVCVPVKADGEACSFDNTCASGACNDGLCGERNECVEGLLRARCGPCSE